jgi:hypothetical protein
MLGNLLFVFACVKRGDLKAVRCRRKPKCEYNGALGDGGDAGTAKRNFQISCVDAIRALRGCADNESHVDTQMLITHHRTKNIKRDLKGCNNGPEP